MIFVVALVFGFSFSPAHAATGLEYLAAQQNPDGSFGNTATSLATPVQSTAEVLRAYQSLGQQAQPAYAPALGYLNGDNESNTEFLARKIVVNAKAGNDVTALINTLIVNQNADGGFGNQAGDSSSVLDTAYTLESLAVANYTSGALVSSTAGYLLSKQSATGGWGNGVNDPSVYVTAQAMRALWFYRNTYVGVSTALTSAQNFLLALRGVDGAWREPFETALALLAIAPNLTDRTLVDDSVAALSAAQVANGSWSDDPYTTALVLQALSLASSPKPNPDLTSVHGRITANGLGLAGATVTITGPVTRIVTTAADGSFDVDGLPAGMYTIVYSVDGYGTVTQEVVTEAGQSVDLGATQLTSSGPLAPDLAVVSVDATQVTNDPTTLALGGILKTTVINQGVAQAPNGYELLAFDDVNRNGAFDGADIVLGRTTAIQALTVGSTETVAIPVSGSTTFRDAPISVWLDSTQWVLEGNEDNNFAVTTSACETPPQSVSGISVPAGYNVEIFASSVTMQQGPIQLSFDRLDNLYVATGSGSTIVKIAAGSNTPTPFGAGHVDPDGVITDTQNNVIVADGSRTRKYTPAGAVMWTASCPGNTQLAAIDAADNVYIGTLSNIICKIPADGSTVKTFTGLGQASEPVIGPDGFLYVGQFGSPNRLIKVDPNTGAIVEVVVNNLIAVSPTFDRDGNIYVGAGGGIFKVSLPSKATSTFATGFQSVRALIFDRHGYLFVGDNISKRVYRIYPRKLSVDLTAGQLRIDPGNAGGSASLNVRIGNAGSGATKAGAVVRFYEGNPASGGRVLGQTVLGSLASGEYADVTLNNVTGLTGTTDLYAMADATNRVVECREDNNIAQATPLANVRGNITVGTDSGFYGPYAPVAISAMITNTGSFSATFSAELRIEDSQGVEVARFTSPSVGPLAGGDSAPLGALWNTQNTLAGVYSVRGLLYSTDGALLNEARSNFTIGQTSTDTALAALRVTTDRPTYYTTDVVTIHSLMTNLTVNRLIEGAALRLTIRDPFGQAVYTQTLAVGQLLPNLFSERFLPYQLTMAPVAVYTIQGELLDGTGILLAAAQTQYEVRNDLTKALTGKVEALLSSLEVGTAQTCTDTLTNQGTVTASGIEVHHALLNLDTQQLVGDQTVTITLASGASNQATRNLATGSLTAGHYACALMVRFGNELRTLAYAPFEVKVPPIRVSAEMRVGTRGRLLVMLDHAVADPKNPNADADPYGLDVAPRLGAQRAFLEMLLKKAGWSYTITDTADDFTRELRTGGYSVYALFTEQEKLAEQVQKELREAVFRGEGLLEAGSHDQRQGRIDEALGIKYIGQFTNGTMVEMTPSPLHDGGQGTFLFDDKELRAELEGAQSAGRYLGGNGDRRDAMTYHEYGMGKSVYAGFDLLAQATAAGEQSLFTALILNSLNHVHPASLATTGGSVIPVDIALANLGVTAQVKVQLALSAGTTLVDAGTAQVADGVMTWETMLAAGESKTLTFWLRLPAPGQLTLAATVSAGVNSESLLLVAEPNMTLPVSDPESLTSVMNRIDTLLNGQNPNSQSLKQARKFVEKALGHLHPALAIADLLKAADFLVDIADPDVVSIRVAIGQWIRWASPYAY